MTNKVSQRQLLSVMPNYVDDQQDIKPYSNTWTASKEIFLCKKVLHYMPDILTKSKTSLWKKVLDDFNRYFNSNAYKIKQSRTMRDKFLRLYGRFLNENKPVERMTQLERILNLIKIGELSKPRQSNAFKGDSHAIASGVPVGNSSLEDDLDEDQEEEKEDEEEEEEEEDEEDDEVTKEPQNAGHIVQPPIVPTQKLGNYLPNYNSSLVQPRIESQRIVAQPLPTNSQPHPVQNEQRFQNTSSAPLAVHLGDIPSGYATVHFKLPNEIDQVHMRIENIEGDLSKIKQDVDIIKSQLASVLSILNGGQQGANR